MRSVDRPDERPDRADGSSPSGNGNRSPHEPSADPRREWADSTWKRAKERVKVVLSPPLREPEVDTGPIVVPHSRFRRASRQRAVDLDPLLAGVPPAPPQDATPSWVTRDLARAPAPPLTTPLAPPAPPAPVPEVLPTPTPAPAPSPDGTPPPATEEVAPRPAPKPAQRPRRVSTAVRWRRRRPRVRKVNRVVRRIDAWSVFKISVIFWAVVYVVVLVAGVLLWNVATTTGTIDNVEGFLEDVFGLERFEFDGRQLFEASWALAAFLVVAGTGLFVTLTVVYNLLADLVGGVRVTVLEEEVVLRERAPEATAPPPAPPPEAPQAEEAAAPPSVDGDGSPTSSL